MPLKLMYITNHPTIALIAEKHGVDRIWVDLETLGKEERQKGINTTKSRHSVEDIKVIAPRLKSSEMLVRVNPWNEASVEEIDAVINAEAEIVMLPMWRSLNEVQCFLGAVNGRAKTMLLLETKEAMGCLDDVLALEGIDELHIGLNDLHLCHGMVFMFELLADGTVEALCNKAKAKHISYGFGGIASIGSGLLPAEMIVMEHYRLGSTRAILSRGFCDNSKAVQDIEAFDRVFQTNMKALRAYEEYAENADEEMYNKNKEEVVVCVSKVVEKLMKGKE